MISANLSPLTQNTAAGHSDAIGKKADFCMNHYRPYLRKDFCLHQLSLITNIPEQDLENYFGQLPLPFDQYLCQWRINHAKILLKRASNWNLDIKTVGSLSGFSSTKKFTEAFIHREGISPLEYQKNSNNQF